MTAGIIDLNTPTGRMVARQLCTIARYESEHRAERVKVARERQARGGKFGGGRRPYGFEPDGVTVRDSEATVIEQCARAVLSGVPVREIARDLRKLGVPTCDGRQWEASYIRDVLLRPRNAGLLVHRPGVRGRVYYTGDDVIGNLPGDPILEPDTYWSVVHKLTDPARRTNHAGTAPKWFGSGIYRCRCGATLRVQNKKYTKTNRRTGERWQLDRLVYRCQSTDAGHVTVPMAELDALVVETLIELIRTSDPEDIIGTPGDGVDVAALRAELATHRAKLDEIAADYDNDLITRSQMLTRPTSGSETPSSGRAASTRDQSPGPTVACPASRPRRGSRSRWTSNRATSWRG